MHEPAGETVKAEIGESTTVLRNIVVKTLIFIMIYVLALQDEQMQVCMQAEPFAIWTAAFYY